MTGRLGFGAVWRPTGVGGDWGVGRAAFHIGEPSSPSPVAWRGAVWWPAGVPGIREPDALAQPTRSRATIRSFEQLPLSLSAKETRQPPRRPLPIPMVKRSSAFLGLEAASLVIAALAHDAQAESGAVPRAERGSPPIPRIYCLPRRERRQRTRSRPTKRRALRTRGIFPYPSGSPLLACLVSRHT
jgi:hypothetical protein